MFAHHARLVLGQLAVAEEEQRNSLRASASAAAAAEGTVACNGGRDATQVATAKLICATLRSHYLMVVKSNQAKLLARITALPWCEVPVVATDDTRGHGRIEHRTLKVLTAARGIGFPYAKQIVQITRERLVVATGQRSAEVVYAVCSLPFEHARPAMIADWLRQHWGIENSVHWVRDVTFDEDRHRPHRYRRPDPGHAAQHRAQPPPPRRSHQHRRSLPRTALTADRRLDLLDPQMSSSQAC